MKINKMISSYNFNKGVISRIKYIVIHYVGGLSDAESNAKYFAGGDRNASAHYFVGTKGDIWQSVEDANIAWHCGAKKYLHPDCRNKNSIGIELCVKKKNPTSLLASDKDWYFTEETINSAVELTQELMKKYNVPNENVIRHYDVTGKICPAPFVHDGNQWLEFITKIQNRGYSSSFASNNNEHITPKDDNETIIWNFFRSKGLNEYAVAGLMGNLFAESGLKSNNLQNSYNKSLGLTDEEYTSRVNNGTYTNFVKDKAGYGLAQWTFHSRKQALLNFAKSSGLSIDDLHMQLEFLWKELQGYKVVFQILLSAKNIKSASDIVLTGFEKPADQSESVKTKRESYGQKYYDRFGGK